MDKKEIEEHKGTADIMGRWIELMTDFLESDQAKATNAKEATQLAMVVKSLERIAPAPELPDTDGTSN